MTPRESARRPRQVRTRTAGVLTARWQDAAGVTNCSGASKVCSPLWIGTTPFYVTRLALANGLVYAPLCTVTIAGGITTPLAMTSGMIDFSTGYLGSYHYDLCAVGLP